MEDRKQPFSVPKNKNSKRGYCCLGLDNVKTDANVGSILRLASNFDVSLVALGGTRYSRQVTDCNKSYRHVPVMHNISDLHEIVPYDCVPVAIELLDGAKSLIDYCHPERAFYVFGAEDATLGQRVLSWCRDVVYIPTNHCLNLSMCVGIVLYDRLVKSQFSAKRV